MPKVLLISSLKLLLQLLHLIIVGIATLHHSPQLLELALKVIKIIPLSTTSLVILSLLGSTSLLVLTILKDNILQYIP